MVQYNDNFIITPMSMKPGRPTAGAQAYALVAEQFGMSSETARNYCKGKGKDKKRYTEVRRWIWDNYQCTWHLMNEDGTIKESGVNF